MKTVLEKYSDNILVICPDSVRERLLEYCAINKIVADVSYISFSEYLKRYSFDYGTDAILYLMNKYSLSVSNAEDMLNNMRYIKEGVVYGHKKLDELVSLFNELKSEGLLEFDPYFKDYLAEKHVIYMGYGQPDKYVRSIVSSQTVDFVYDSYGSGSSSSLPVNIKRFSDSEEEVMSLFENVGELLGSGVSIDKIHVMYDESYSSLIHRYNGYYRFKVEESDRGSLWGTDVCRKFMEYVSCGDKEGTYEYLCSLNNDLSDRLITYLNKYAEYELSEVIPLIEDELVRIPYKSPFISNVITKVELYDLLDSDEYLFVLGFNDKFAHFKKNDSFLDDKVRSLLGMSTIEEENSLIRNSICGYLSNINNLSLSYSNKSAFDKYNEQNLFDDCVYVDCVSGVDAVSSFSSSSLKNRYAYLLDQYRKYGTESEELGIYKHNFGDNGYASFDNRFDGAIGKVAVSLSYSGLNTFYKCPFTWYLKYVLGIKDGSENENIRLGNIAHDLLKEGLENNLVTGCYDSARSALDELFDQLSKKYPSESNYEEHFRQHLKEELLLNLLLIKEQMSFTSLNKRDYEEEYLIDLGSEVGVYSSLSFGGKIDKLVYSENEDSVMFYVVDYKTGSSDDIEEKLMKYGFSLQLPCYLYLLAKAERFRDKKLLFGGIYLQHIINNDIRYDEEKDLLDKKKESLKLTGYSSSDLDRLSLIDSTLLESGAKSELIKGMSITAKGSINARAKVLDDEQVLDMIDNVDGLIKEAYSAISLGKFEIAPKVINGHNKSCKYCPFEDICYKRQKDVKYIDLEED